MFVSIYTKHESLYKNKNKRNKTISTDFTKFKLLRHHRIEWNLIEYKRSSEYPNERLFRVDFIFILHRSTFKGLTVLRGGCNILLHDVRVPLGYEKGRCNYYGPELLNPQDKRSCLSFPSSWGKNEPVRLARNRFYTIRRLWLAKKEHRCATCSN